MHKANRKSLKSYSAEVAENLPGVLSPKRVPGVLKNVTCRTSKDPD